MFRKVVLCLLFSLAALPVYAQVAGDSLIVILKNGQRVAIPLSEIRKITFDTLTAGVGRGFQPDPSHLHLSPSYPDPAQHGATISFAIPVAGSVTVTISSIKGEEVRRIIVPNCQAGDNRIIWDGLDGTGASVPSGVYYYEVRFKGEVQRKEMVVIR